MICCATRFAQTIWNVPRTAQGPASRPGTCRPKFRVVWPDGNIRYVWVMSDEPERDSNGDLLRGTGVMQDITERKLREVEREELVWQLQSTAEQLAQVVRCAPDAVVLLDNLGCVLLTDPKADTLLTQHAAFDEEGGSGSWPVLPGRNCW